jgi:hypothetical protein
MSERIGGAFDETFEIYDIKGLNYPILGYAIGSYLCTCVNCEKTFMGDKYARQCLPCAVNALNEEFINVVKENNKLKNVVKDLNRIKNLLNDMDLND